MRPFAPLTPACRAPYVVPRVDRRAGPSRYAKRVLMELIARSEAGDRHERYRPSTGPGLTHWTDVGLVIGQASVASIAGRAGGRASPTVRPEPPGDQRRLGAGRSGGLPAFQV